MIANIILLATLAIVALAQDISLENVECDNFKEGLPAMQVPDRDIVPS